MSYWRDDTRYGWPPDRDPFEPFPTVIPWDVPISELSNLWLYISGGGRTVEMPLKLMAAQRGWNLTLRQIIPRLKQDGTDLPPECVMLVGQGFEAKMSSRHPYHVLMGEPPKFRD